MGEAGKTEETTSWHGNRCVHPGGILGWSRTGRLVLVMSTMRAREREKQARPSSSSSRAWMHVNNNTERTEHPSAVHRMCFVSRSIGLHVLCHFESRLSLALAPPPVVILALLLPPTVLPYITTYIIHRLLHTPHVHVLLSTYHRQHSSEAGWPPRWLLADKLAIIHPSCKACDLYHHHRGDTVRI